MTLAPLIFCHYGDSDYLLFVLKQARISNPKTRVVLLGDESNEGIAIEAGVEHRLFESYGNTPEIKIFNEVYQHVAGKNHGRKHWTNFVFKRWFYIYSFLKEQGVNEFWHFDSDNMILDDLNTHNYKFNSYECTEQCESFCMNGYVSGINVVKGYLNTVNLLFQDQKYITEQKENLIDHPTFAFTEMRAYTAYRDQESIKSIRLNTIIDGETFDDCICFKDGFTQYSCPINYRRLKKIYFNDEGIIYFKRVDSGQYIKVITLNLSWVPIEIFKSITNISSGKWNNSIKYVTNRDGLYELDLSNISQRNSHIVNLLKSILPEQVRNKLRKYQKVVKQTFKSA